MVRPAAARRTRIADQVGAKLMASVKKAEASTEATITGFRPSVSEIAPATSMAGAIRPVVAESARLACAAPSPKVSEKTGNNGWT